MTALPSSLGGDAVAIIVSLAMQRAGLPPAVVALVLQSGPALAREVLALLEQHERGVPLEVFRAELPDQAAALDAIERGDR